MKIQLFGTPPSADEIEQARLRYAGEWHQTELKRTKVMGLGFVALLTAPALAFLLLNPDQIGGRGYQVMLSVFAVVLLGFLVGGANWPQDPDFTESDFKPVDAFWAQSIIKAASLDPRVDAYRRQVVAQGRPFTLLEGRTCQNFCDFGFVASQRQATLYSSAPLPPDAVCQGERSERPFEGGTTEVPSPNA